MSYRSASDVALGPDDVAITLGYGVLGAHVGVALHDENGTPVAMDFAFHRHFRVKPYPGDVGQWAACTVPLPPLAAASAVAFIRAMGSKFVGKGGEGLNYGIALKLGEGSITSDEHYVPPPGSDGHTCATIVAEMFRAAQLPLVEVQSWKVSKENVIWGEAVQCMLSVYAKTRPQSQAFGQAKLVKKNNEGFRLLPEEVAAAGQLPSSQRPVKQCQQLTAAAKQATAELQSVCVAPQNRGIFEKCAEQYEAGVAKLAQLAKAEVEDQAKMTVAGSEQQAVLDTPATPTSAPPVAD